MACLTFWHVLIACKCEDPAPAHPCVSFQGLSATQDFAPGFQDGTRGFFQISLDLLFPDCCVAQKQTLCPRKLIYSPAIFHDISGGRNSCYQGQSKKVSHPLFTPEQPSSLLGWMTAGPWQSCRAGQGRDS